MLKYRIEEAIANPTIEEPRYTLPGESSSDADDPQADGGARSARGGRLVDYEMQEQRGDYYVSPKGEQVKRPGRWIGRVAKALGLVGDVSLKEFLQALDGRHPRTGERIVGFRKDRVAGHDVTLSMSKSGSVAWALGNEETSAAMDRALDEAAAEMVAYAEAHVPVVRRYEKRGDRSSRGRRGGLRCRSRTPPLVDEGAGRSRAAARSARPPAHHRVQRPAA